VVLNVKGLNLALKRLEVVSTPSILSTPRSEQEEEKTVNKKDSKKKMESIDLNSDPKVHRKNVYDKIFKGMLASEK